MAEEVSGTPTVPVILPGETSLRDAVVHVVLENPGGCFSSRAAESETARKSTGIFNFVLRC